MSCKMRHDLLRMVWVLLNLASSHAVSLDQLQQLQLWVLFEFPLQHGNPPAAQAGVSGVPVLEPELTEW